MQFSSSLLENAVNEFAKLPGIGKKTALRLVLHLLKQDEGIVQGFGETIIMHDAFSKGAINYLNLAREILQKNNLTDMPNEEKVVKTIPLSNISDNWF